MSRAIYMYRKRPEKTFYSCLWLTLRLCNQEGKAKVELKIPCLTMEDINHTRKETLGKAQWVTAIFNILSIVSRTKRQKINQIKEDWEHTIDQLNLTDIYRKLYPPTAGFFRINCIFGHKTNINTFEKIEIIQSMFSKYNGMKLGISNKRKFEKFINVWKSNMFLSKMTKNETKGKSENSLR